VTALLRELLVAITDWVVAGAPSGLYNEFGLPRRSELPFFALKFGEAGLR
jgi:hypothetical protein